MTAHPSVLPSVSRKHDSHQRDFCAISYLGLVLELVEIFQLYIQLDKNNRHFTQITNAYVDVTGLYNGDRLFSVRCKLRPIKQLTI